MTDTTHKNIEAALLAAQPNFKEPKKNTENKHFGKKYADLSAVIDAVKPALNEQGIVYFHEMRADELGERMVTVLCHPESGTKREFPVPMFLLKRDMQGLKAAHTYAKRIGLEDATGVAAADDDDAEGNRQQDSGMGAALKDAWKQGVLDSIPENATPAEKAEAFADAICADFADKGRKALDNRWNKHKALIESIQQRFPALGERICDAYENRKMELDGTDVPRGIHAIGE